MTTFGYAYNNSCTFCGSSFGAKNNMTACAIMACAFIFSMVLTRTVALVRVLLVVLEISIITIIICVIIKKIIKETREYTVVQ